LADDNSSDYFLKIGYPFIADFGKNGNLANSKFKVVLTTVHTTKAKQQISLHLLAFLQTRGEIPGISPYSAQKPEFMAFGGIMAC